MGKPAVGSGEEHGSNVARGAAEANAVRSRWLTSLFKGEVKFRVLASASYSKSEDRHLSAMRLYSILKARPGWSINTALQALEQNGFERKTTIMSIRRSAEKVAIFESILETSAERWRGRPEVPAGWPWNGKLSVLVSNAGESLPSDLAALFGPDDDDVELPTPQAIPSEDIMNFFDDESPSSFFDDED